MTRATLPRLETAERETGRVGRQRKREAWLAIAFMKPVLYTEIAAMALVAGGVIAAIAMPQLPPTVKVLLWVGPLSVFLPFLVVSSLYATYLVYRRRGSGSAGIADGSTGSGRQPLRVRYLGWEAEEAAQPGTQMAGPWLTRLKLGAEPLPSPGRPGERHVAARIELRDAPGERPLFSVRGRWAVRPAGMAGGWVSVPAEEITMPGEGQRRALNIVLKYDEDDGCYIPNGKAPDPAVSGGRDPETEIGPGEHCLRVVLQGDGVDEAFWFRLVNRGRGHQIRISPLPGV